MRDDPVLLVIATDQEKDLGLECVTIPVGVKIAEKWIFFEDFEQEFRGEGAG